MVLSGDSLVILRVKFNHLPLSGAQMAIKAYHGTTAKFERFNDQRQGGVNYGIGIYLTGCSEDAKAFLYDAKGFVLEVEFRAESLFDIRSNQHEKMLAYALGLDWSSVQKNYNHMLEGSGLDESDRENHYHKIVNELFDIGAGPSYQVLKSGIREVLEGLGFDGIYDPLKNWWVAFRADQINIVKRTFINGPSSTTPEFNLAIHDFPAKKSKFGEFVIKNNQPDENGYFIIEALSGRKRIAWVTMKHLGNSVRAVNESEMMDGLYVELEFRRRGIATAIYKHVEKVTGVLVVPADDQSFEAKAFWSNLSKI
jgi:hypothetical protein